jgi:hypothetical protein
LKQFWKYVYAIWIWLRIMKTFSVFLDIVQHKDSIFIFSGSTTYSRVPTISSTRRTSSWRPSRKRASSPLPHCLFYLWTHEHTRKIYLYTKNLNWFYHNDILLYHTANGVIVSNTLPLGWDMHRNIFCLRYCIYLSSFGLFIITSPYSLI